MLSHNKTRIILHINLLEMGKSGCRKTQSRPEGNQRLPYDYASLRKLGLSHQELGLCTISDKIDEKMLAILMRMDESTLHGAEEMKKVQALITIMKELRKDMSVFCSNKLSLLQNSITTNTLTGPAYALGVDPTRKEKQCHKDDAETLHNDLSKLIDMQKRIYAQNLATMDGKDREKNKKEQRDRIQSLEDNIRSLVDKTVAGNERQ